MRKLTLTLGLVAVVMTGVVTSSSQATMPGKNGQIAFRRYFDRNHSHGAIFVINPDGSGLREITRTPKLVVDDQPDWSSDGELLVFASNRDKVGRSAKSIYSAIFTVRADGSELTRLSPECASPAPDPVGCPYESCRASHVTAGRLCSRGRRAWSRSWAATARTAAWS